MGHKVVVSRTGGLTQLTSSGDSSVGTGGIVIEELSKQPERGQDTKSAKRGEEEGLDEKGGGGCKRGQGRPRASATTTAAVAQRQVLPTYRPKMISQLWGKKTEYF